MSRKLELTIHHVGCLVKDIEVARAAYRGTSIESPESPIIRIESQQVAVCFLPAGNGTFIELVQPDSDNRALQRMLTKGQYYYHVGYYCEDLQAVVDHFLESGSHLVGSFKSEAFHGAKCVFLINGDGQLTEFIEKVKPAI